MPFEDPYKAEGNVKFKIEKLSKFAQAAELYSYRLSDTIYVRGLPWKILAGALEKQNDDPESTNCFGYMLKCDSDNNDPGWTCKCTASMKILAKKAGKEDLPGTIDHVFNANSLFMGVDKITFDELMEPENGWYDELTDSIIIHAHIAADAPHGVTNMPDDVYTEYTLRSEHALFVEYNDDFENNGLYSTSSMPIEDKLWSFSYSPLDDTLILVTSMHQSDSSETTAELIFWYWNDKEIAILEKSVHTLGDEESMANSSAANSRMKSTQIAVHTNGSIPANNKFNVVIRLLDERIAFNSLVTYYSDYKDIETVNLNIIGGTKEESFIVPKHDLMRASPVFQRMFANPMTEKTTGTVEIEDTNPEEFGDFLKAISPKQELPNPSNVFALLILADRYDCKLLRGLCEKHLMNCVEIPFIHRLKCANSYELNKLKNNLMVSIDGTGLFNLLQQTEPYFGILKELTRKRKHK